MTYFHRFQSLHFIEIRCIRGADVRRFWLLPSEI
jgi:hypothetical protein